MRLFWKIYLGILLSVAAVACALAYLSSVHQIRMLEDHIIDDNRTVAALMAKQIELGQVTLHWPFASLETLTRRQDFRFWWVIEEGTIRLADDARFMGTAPPSGLPKVKPSSSKPVVVLDRVHDLGLVVCPVHAPEQQMSFWLGFSLRSVRESREHVLLLTTGVTLVALVLLGLALWVVVQHFIRPLQELERGAQIVGLGGLGHRMAVRSHDEIGSLVAAFNRMTENLERTTVSKDYVNAIVTELVDALIVFDQQGTILTANRGACQLLGYTEAELVGSPIDLVLDPADTMIQPSSIVAAGAVHNYETSYRRRDGSLVSVLFGASLLRQPQQDVLVVSTGRDISERKRAEEIRERLIEELRSSLRKIKTLRGLVPICAACKKIRDDKGFWKEVEVYVRDHSEAKFSHGICPECSARLYPELVKAEAQGRGDSETQ